MAKVGRTLTRAGARLTPEIRRAWERNPVLPPERYGAIVRLLVFFAEQLSALSNQLLVEQQNQEPPFVARARRYIDQHKTEQVSLAGVAAAAGASVFHFSKVFHKSTGLTFTDYVARVRAESARTRLLNPAPASARWPTTRAFRRSPNFIALLNASSGSHPVSFALVVIPETRRAREGARSRA
jgi:hypothetical protein